MGPKGSKKKLNTKQNRFIQSVYSTLIKFSCWQQTCIGKLNFQNKITKYVLCYPMCLHLSTTTAKKIFYQF